MTDREAEILVIDDVEGVARLHQFWLREEGYTVDIGTDGDPVPDRVGETYDVLVLDRAMPDPSGDEILARIEARGAVPGVVITSAIHPDMDVLSLLVDDYLVKPISKSELVEAVDRMLHREAYDQSLREFAAVVTKVALIRREIPRGERMKSEAYRSLVDRLFELEQTVAPTLDELDEATVTALFGTEDRVALARRPADVLDLEPTERFCEY